MNILCRIAGPVLGKDFSENEICLKSDRFLEIIVLNVIQPNQ